LEYLHVNPKKFTLAPVLAVIAYRDPCLVWHATNDADDGGFKVPGLSCDSMLPFFCVKAGSDEHGQFTELSQDLCPGQVSASRAQWTFNS
jgi:hypothetical protein